MRRWSLRARWMTCVGCFARSIEQRLRMAGVRMDSAQLRASSYAVAGSLFSLLDWWLKNNMAMEPKDMDTLFHQIVWNGIGDSSR